MLFSCESTATTRSNNGGVVRAGSISAMDRATSWEHLTIMDDFEVVGVTRFRFGRTR